ncbi:hypothetical protein UB39_13995 [Photobacterium angustum]|nr:hypothetical protein UB39_13995 [Photobacterium angustum]
MFLSFVQFFSSYAVAALCTDTLQEEANVFEVECMPEIKVCLVIGYITDPKFSNAYNGVVANLQPVQKKNRKEEVLDIRTYRNGIVESPTPKGYFLAMAAAEQMLLGERGMSLLYFDAFTGEIVPRPDIKTKCESYN